MPLHFTFKCLQLPLATLPPASRPVLLTNPLLLSNVHLIGRVLIPKIEIVEETWLTHATFCLLCIFPQLPLLLRRKYYVCVRSLKNFKKIKLILRTKFNLGTQIWKTMIYLSLKGFLRMYLKKCPQLSFGKKKKLC